MSVQELFDFQVDVLRDWLRNPRAWLLRANPVWGSHETVNQIALFDTKEQAEAYVKASELPKPLNPDDNRTDDGYWRTYRPDSLLFDYNAQAWDGPMVVPAIPWHDYDGVQKNRTPPTGPAPALNTRTSAHISRYGHDYDVGLGGPYSNENQRLPEPPLAEDKSRFPHESSER
jgi:hypothetical protein